MIVSCDKVEKSAGQQCTAVLTAVGDALYAVGGKWTLRVIIALTHGNKRFSTLQRTIPGLSARVLSNELKELELNGFVRRVVHPKATPVLVEYELTDYCHTLADVVRSLSEWGTKHRQNVREIDK